MSKGKIVFRVGEFPTKSETFVTNQIVLAIQLGYEIQIVTGKKNSIQDSSQPELIKKFNLLEKTLVLSKPGGLLKRASRILRALITPAFWKYLKTLNPAKYGPDGPKGNILAQLIKLRTTLDGDIYHVTFANNSWPFDQFKKHSWIQGKIVTTFLGYDIHYNELTIGDKVNEFKEYFEIGDLFTAITKYLADQALELNCKEEKLKIIPLPINTDYFNIQEERDENQIPVAISVGRLIPWKGHRYAIRAIKILVDSGLEIKYLIIGEGSERQKLQDLISELALNEQVVLLGSKNQSEIKDLLQTSDIFIIPSTHDDTGRRETQGVVTGEAQACGLPVIGFRSGGVPYTMKEGVTGFLSEENDVEGMAANIEKLVLDANLRRKMGVEARKFVVENYSKDLILEQWNDLYNVLKNE